jgi:DNA-binding transcriptional ArsR family regulator
MDLHQLRVFQAAVKSGGFRPSWRRHPACRAATLGSAGELRSPKPAESRASEQLHLSQSTVSQHIKVLEEELGCPLFLRVGKRVMVTEAAGCCCSTPRPFSAT